MGRKPNCLNDYITFANAFQSSIRFTVANSSFKNVFLIKSEIKFCLITKPTDSNLYLKLQPSLYY